MTAKPDIIISARTNRAAYIPGAEMVPCSECGGMCWASLRSQGEMKKHPNLRLLCMECAEALLRRTQIN